MKRLNILWLTSWYPNKYDLFDGDFIQRHARAASLHHDIHVICVKGEENGIEQAVPPAMVDGLSETVLYSKGGSGIGARFHKQILWRQRFADAVATHVAQHGLPHVVHVHIPWKAGLIALQIKKQYGIPFIVTEHWGIYNKVVPDNFSNRSFVVRMLLARIIRESKVLVSVSKYLGKAISGTVTRKPYFVIPNVVDTSLFFILPPPSGTFTFIHVSNMVPLKNVSGILLAYKQFRAQSSSVLSRLLMVGNRDEEWFRYAQSIGLTQGDVTFTGEISYPEVARQMQRAHCVLLNSTIENAPCAISEALCCGLPVIATAVGGIPEMIHEGNGYLIPPSDDGALARAMHKMQTAYASFDRTRIAEEAAALYGTHSIAASFDKLYTGS
ncbi:MAG TPA: glycosyltransferase [Flavisolibacter sp.]|nr:glycosyltransferase [Flavisolibacter sp.]